MCCCLRFLEPYGCIRNALDDIGYVSYDEYNVLRTIEEYYENNETWPEIYYGDEDYHNHTKEIFQLFGKELYFIISSEEEKFDNLCSFLKERRIFEYLINKAADCRISLWNIEILFNPKYVEKFNVSKEEMYSSYCNLIDKIRDGSFENIDDEMEDDNYYDEEWVREEIREVFMLPNGWFVCECENVYLDDVGFAEYLYFDEALLYVGSLNKCFRDDVDSFFEFKNTDSFKNHKAERIIKIQEKYRKDGITISSLNEDDYSDLIWLHQKQIKDIHSYIYTCRCNWVNYCCHTVAIIAQYQWKIHKDKIKLSKSLEKDLHIDVEKKELFLKEIEKTFDIEIDKEKFMNTITIKDVFEIVVQTIDRLQKTTVELKDYK